MEHKYEINHRQSEGNKNDSDEPTDRTLHAPVMVAESFASPGCISQFTKQSGKKAENQPNGQCAQPTEKAASQQSGGQSNHSQPAKEKQHTTA